jgi:hypothetical protein
VTARPVDSHDPDDPVEILVALPEGYRAQFLARYTVAVESAQRPEHSVKTSRRTAAAWAMEEA